jgi:hypothetical protein
VYRTQRLVAVHQPAAGHAVSPGWVELAVSTGPAVDGPFLHGTFFQVAGGTADVWFALAGDVVE